MQKTLGKVGWIGTGVMGKSMASHLLKKGYELDVFNRTASKAQDLVNQGAQFKETKDIAVSCDKIFLMLGYPQDVEYLVFEKDGGLINLMKPGAFLIDHTTSRPALSQRIYKTCNERGIISIDAPVSGGDIGARNAQLVTMCGGDEPSFAPISEIMSTYSKKVTLLGEAGAGQHTKMVNQINIAGSMIGVCEGLIYAKKSGLDLQKTVDTISGGGAASFSLNSYSPRILKGDMEPGFYVEHFVKDMEIALDECRRMNITLPGLALVHQLYRSVMAHGKGRCGTQALIRALESMNNITL